MARIRSIVPGIFTDERWVQVSFAARLLFFGLEVEADDQGSFEWRPVSLKMRLFPNDPVDIGELMAELVRVDLIRGYELDGRQYGAVREFCARQKPKKPNTKFPMPAEFRDYTLYAPPSSEPVPHQYGTSSDDAGSGGEKPSLMERRGEEKERKEESFPSAAAQTAEGAGTPPPPERLLAEFDKAVRLTWPEIGPRRRAHSDPRVAEELIAAGVNPAEFGPWCMTWLAEWTRKPGNGPVGSLNALRGDALAWSTRRTTGAANGTGVPPPAIDWDAASRGADDLLGVRNGQ